MIRILLRRPFEFGVPLLLAAAVLTSGGLAGCSDGVVTFMQKTGSKHSEPVFFKPAEEDIVDDADTAGLKIIKDVISVTFNSNTDEKTINRIISSVNGEIVGYDKAVNYYQIRFKGKSLEEVGAIRQTLLSKYKEVELAATLPVSVHRNPYYVK